MSIAPSTLEDAIRQSGEGWLIDWFTPPEQAMDHIRSTLQAIQQIAHERLTDNAPEVSETALVEEYHRNPRQIRGFFQSLGGTRTPEMLLMVWRILQGMEVKSIRVEYQRQDSFELQVVLESPSGEVDPMYRSGDIHDFALFRHIGIMEIGGRPVLDGFYPLKIERSWTRQSRK